MKDSKKTKKQLIAELHQLREKLADSVQMQSADPVQGSDISHAPDSESQRYMHIGSIIVNRDFMIADIDDDFRKNTGLREGDLIGKHCNEVTLDLDKFCPIEKMEHYLQEVFTSGLGCDFVNEWNGPDENSFVSVISMEPLQDEKGVVNQVCFTIKRPVAVADKTLEIDLKDEEYRLLFENTPDILFVFSPDFTIKRVSPSVERVLGYTQDELIGKTLLDTGLLEEEYREKALVESKIILEGKKIPSTTYEFVDKYGQIKNVEISGSPVIHDNVITSILCIARDVSDATVVKKALHESEKRYRALYEGAAEGILVANIHTKQFLYANPAICKMLEYPEDELLQMSVMDIHPEESLDFVVGEFDKQARGEILLAANIPCLTKSGSILYVDVRTSNITVDGQECNTGFFSDISERKRIEEELGKSKAELQAIFKAMIDVVLVVDSDGRYVKIAPTNPDLLYKPPEEILGKTVFEVFPKEQAVFFYDHIQQAFSSDHSIHLEYSLTINDREIWFAGVLSKMTDETVVLVARDITDYKEALYEIAANENRYRSLVEDMQEGLGIVDKNETIVFCNTAFGEAFGYGKDEIIGMNLNEFVEEDDYLRLKQKTNLRQKGISDTYELTIRRRNGERRSLRISASPWMDEKRQFRGTKGLLLDVTEYLKLENALQTQLDKLKLMDRINRIIQENTDIDRMLNEAMYEVNEIYGSDRAWLLYPCDPDNPTFHVPVECSRPGYPGAFELNVELPMKSGADGVCQAALDSEDPVPHGPSYEHKIYPSLTDQFGVQSQLVFAIYPLTGKPWLFGIHQCSHAREWTTNEIQLFKEIGRRLADGLSSMLFMHELRKSETRFKTLSNLTFEGIVLHDNGIVIDANESLLNMVGYSREELLGENIITKCVQKEYHKVILENISKRHSSPYEIVALNKDGTPHHVELEGRDVELEGRNFRVAAIRDITERKASQEALRRSEEKHRTYVKNAPDAIFISDANGKYVDVNEAACLMTGYSKEELLSMSIPELAAPGMDFNSFRDLKKEGKIKTEVRLRKKSGRTIHASLNAVALGDGTYMAFCSDITERKRTEQEIMEKERFISSLLYSIPTPVFFKDKDGRYQGCNRAFTEFTGLTPDDIMGKSVNEVWSDEVADIYRKKDIELLKSQEYQIYEYVMRDLNGSLRPVLFAKNLYHDENGHIVGLIGAFIDITDMKAAEESQKNHIHFLESLETINQVIIQAKDENDLLQNVVESLYEIFECDRSWLLYPCNPESDSFEIPYEKSHPDYPGITITHGSIEVTEEQRRFYRLLLESTMPTAFMVGQDYLSEELMDRFMVKSVLAIPLLTKIGKPWLLGIHQCSYGRIWTNNEIQLFKEIGGRVVDSLNSLLFLRDLRNSEKALRESESRLRSVIEQSNDAIYIYYNGKLDLVNRRFIDLTGVTPDQITEEGLDILTHIDEENRQIVRKHVEAIRNGEKTSDVFELNLKLKDGEQLQVQANIVEINYRDSKAILGTLRDITELKSLEKMLLQSQKIESIGHLAGGIAHDFNNLLTPIIGNTELALLDLNPADPLYRDIQEISDTAERAKNLTRQLLAFSRKQILDVQVVDMNRLIENFRKILRRTIREDIRIETNYGHSLGLVRVDISQMEQVLMNLLVNAQDAMPFGGDIGIRTEALVVDSDYAERHPDIQTGEYVLLSISDNGEGMDQDTSDRIFDPFFTTKEAGKGTGLGLSTVYGIVKQLGGSIIVDSQLGKGTVFSIYLPVNEEDQREETETIDDIYQSQGDETILIVEDQEPVRRIAERILGACGYDIFLAGDGIEALELIAKKDIKIDLLLTDVVMPHLNGRELYMKLVETHPDMKVLFMSGYTQDVIAHHGVLDKGIDFIEKPLSVTSLTKKIREILDRR